MKALWKRIHAAQAEDASAAQETEPSMFAAHGQQLDELASRWGLEREWTDAGVESDSSLRYRMIVFVTQKVKEAAFLCSNIEPSEQEALKVIDTISRATGIPRRQRWDVITGNMQRQRWDVITGNMQRDIETVKGYLDRVLEFLTGACK